MEKQRIIDGKGRDKLTEAERLQMASLLIKMGYTVRIKSEKVGETTTKQMVIEYWTE